MKQRFNSVPILLFSLISGFLGLGLQIWQNTTGIDASGLLIPDQLSTYLLLGLTVFVLIILYYLATGIPKDIQYNDLAKTRLYCMLGSICGAVGIAAMLLLRTFPSSFTFLCVGGILLLLWQIYVRQDKSARFWVSCALTVFLLLVPLSQYPTWCVETQMPNYAYPLLATLSILLAAYHRAEGEFGVMHSKRLVFFHSLAIYFGITCASTQLGLLTAGMALWCAFDLLRLQSVVHIRMALPETVAKCIRTLTDAGYPAYAVGGCVRDTQLGEPVQDYDLCTSATPDQIAEIFSQYRLIRAGEKHGTVGVVIDDAVYEITTFRAEGEYKDNRHPDWVSFVDDLEQDLSRRDFTVNAMAYSPVTGLQDPWGGTEDLKKRILRAVGDPEKRFREDSLRILRGVRFSIRYGLTPDAKTGKAMAELAPLMDNLARERVFDEMCKILLMCNAQDLLRFAPVFLQVIPELKPTVDFQQKTPHHAYDVFTHTAYVVENTPEDLTLRWAALLHDIGKPDCFTQDEDGRGHFYGHADISAEKANEILHRLKAPTALREQVVFLIKNHMLVLPADPAVLRRRLSRYGEENIKALIRLQKADYSGKGVTDAMPPFVMVESIIRSILDSEQCLHLRDLAVNGTDLMAIGYPEGKLLGEALNHLLDCVLDEKIPNERMPLLRAAFDYLQERTNAQ